MSSTLTFNIFRTTILISTYLTCICLSMGSELWHQRGVLLLGPQKPPKIKRPTNRELRQRDQETAKEKCHLPVFCMPVSPFPDKEWIQDSEEIRALPVTVLGSFAVRNSGRVCPGHSRRPDDAKPVPHWNTVPLASQWSRREKREDVYLD